MNNKTNTAIEFLRRRQPRTKPRTRRRAAALIEMALILPMLVTLVLICVDFGRFATVYTAVTNAAREGANFGGNHPFTDATKEVWQQRINEAVTLEMSGIPGFSDERLEIAEPELIASHQRARVRVAVSYKFSPAMLWPVLPTEMTIARTAEMPVVR